MSPRRVSALARRIITQFRRDRRTLVLMFAVPIIVLSLIGYLVDLKPSDVTVGVVNEDQGVVAANILTAFEDSGDFRLVDVGRDGPDLFFPYHNGGLGDDLPLRATRNSIARLSYAPYSRRLAKVEPMERPCDRE